MADRYGQKIISLEDVKRIYKVGSERIHALDGINLKIGKNEYVAVMGASGSGKSTVAQLLERFYDVSGGAIEINGVNLKSLSVNKFRQITSFVTQEPVLFGGLTLRENIVLGLAKTLATEENIIRACKQSLI